MQTMKKLSNWKWPAGALAAVAGVLLVGGCKDQGGTNGGAAGESGGGTITLGLNTSLTGGTATFGKNTQNGIQMAIDEVNAKGGVLGKKVVLQTEDNASRADESVTAVQKLISSDNVLVVLGDVASSNSLAAAPICQKSKVPMVSPTSTNPKVTQVGDYIFRTCFIDPFQGTVCARFAKDNLKAKTVAIFVDNKSDYSKGLAKYFDEEFSKSGKIVLTSYYSAGDNDFRAQLTNIKAKNPDLLFVPGYYTEVGAIASQARQLGMKQPFLGGDGWDSPKLTEIGKDAVQGAYFSTHYSPESDDPRVQAFGKEYKQKFNGQTPDAMSAVAYDAANIVFAAIEKANATQPNDADRAKIRDALAATKNFPGVTGDITIDKDRNAVKPAVILQVKGNKFAYVTTVKP
jgi:branched-chain amino acid transport system substrate-binding protein